MGCQYIYCMLALLLRVVNGLSVYLMHAGPTPAGGTWAVSVSTTCWPYSAAPPWQLFLGYFFYVGYFMIVYLFCIFLSPGSQLEFRKWRCVPRLERRNGLEEMAPMIATSHETSPSIASSHRGEGASLHIDDPTPPSQCSFGRSSFLTRQSRLHRLGNG